MRDKSEGSSSFNVIIALPYTYIVKYNDISAGSKKSAAVELFIGIFPHEKWTPSFIYSEEDIQDARSVDDVTG